MDKIIITDQIGAARQLNASQFDLDTGILSEMVFIRKYLSKGEYYVLSELDYVRFRTSIEDELNKAEKEAINKTDFIELNKAIFDHNALRKVMYKNGLGHTLSAYVKHKNIVPTEDDLRKSHIAGALKYETNVKITKTGKELKAALKRKEEKISLCVGVLKLEIANLKNKITEEPEEELGEYSYRNTKEELGTIYLYSWSQVKKFCDNKGGNVFTNVNQRIDYDDCDMSRYNNAMYKLISETEDLLVCKIYRKSITDNQKITLTPELLITLFSDEDDE